MAKRKKVQTYGEIAKVMHNDWHWVKYIKKPFCRLKFIFLSFQWFYSGSNSRNCKFSCLLALKSRVYLRLSISRTTNASTFKLWEYLNLEYEKSYVEFGVLVMLYADIPRVGKRIKINVFKSSYCAELQDPNFTVSIFLS